MASYTLRIRLRRGLFLFMTGFAVCSASYAFAQVPGQTQGEAIDPDSEMTALVDEMSETETQEGTLRRVAQLEANGDFSGAATILERYLYVDRNAQEPRAEYAVLLCKLGDFEAGRFEGEKLAAIPVASDIMDRVNAACGSGEAVVEEAP